MHHGSFRSVELRRLCDCELILGCSGAGKTTLLNVLTQNAPYGKSRGTITLNGEEIKKAVFAEHCAVVPQFDDSWGQLTVQETVLSPFVDACSLFTCAADGICCETVR